MRRKSLGCIQYTSTKRVAAAAVAAVAVAVAAAAAVALTWHEMCWGRSGSVGP